MGILKKIKAKLGVYSRRKLKDRVNGIDQVNQIQLFQFYKKLYREGYVEDDLRNIEFSNFSQHGEDGVLLYLFSLIGFEKREVVEICAGDGVECNAANLIVNYGFRGLLFDGVEINKIKSDQFYKKHRSSFARRPIFKNVWITKDNVNSLIEEEGFKGEIDLLSIDLDGNDYWIWDSLSVVSPRVVVIEINPDLGARDVLTIEYQESYAGGVESGYAGASIKALENLGKSKGYSLIYVESHGINAFFMKDSIIPKFLRTASSEECFTRIGISLDGDRELKDTFNWVKPE
jgi:hypothetical protein